LFNIYVTSGSLSSAVSDKTNSTGIVVLERPPRMVNLLNNPQHGRASFRFIDVKGNRVDGRIVNMLPGICPIVMKAHTANAQKGGRRRSTEN
jgi:hypothetical protein